jgi:DNA-binding transcriptional MerR regulator
VARQVDLSLRTVRFYEEAGLLTPAGRTQGGFRLYDEDALDRLLLIKRMKPLGFTLEEMRSLLAVRDELRLPDLAAERRHELQERLKTWAALAEQKLADLRARAGIAADFVAGLHDDATRGSTPPGTTAEACLATQDDAAGGHAAPTERT